MAKSISHVERQKRRRSIALFVKEGNTKKQAMRKFKVSSGQVDRSCIENGITPPYDTQSAKTKHWSFCRVVSELLAGKSRSTVSTDMGVSRQYVYQVIEQAHRHGLIKQIEKLTGRKIVI